MLSRDADACYWIGRYVERAEATARMVDVHFHSSLEAGRSGPRWGALLEISGGSADFQARYAEESDRNAFHFFGFDPQNPSSIRSCWTAARENARAIREQLSSEMWESLNVSYLALRDWDVERVMRGSPHTFFQQVKDASHLFQGILNRTLLMGEARDWLDAGRFLERADQTARLLDVKSQALVGGNTQRQGAMTQPLGTETLQDLHHWNATLKSVSAFEMFRKTHRDGVTAANVVHFLLLNPQFPASTRHGVTRVEGCLRRISGNQRETPANEPERIVGRLRADLTYASTDEILRDGLTGFLANIEERCAALGTSITRTYLSY